MDGRAPGPGAVPLRAAAVLDLRPLIERDLLPVCQRYGMGVIVWGPLNGGWLSGKYRRESDAETFTTGRAKRMPDRFDPAQPDNARKLDLVEQLHKLAADAGMSLRIWGWPGRSSIRR